MEVAVIAAEKNAAQTICENVDNGFYILIKSQISRKAVAAYSEMNSKAGILTQLLKALDNIRSQMQADFNMICRRYNKLFQSLNKSLETRVKELERPAMRLAEIKSAFVFDRLKNDSSLLVSAAEETISIG
jgi:esterase/lipase